MRRITISLPDDLALAMEREAKRRGTSVSAVAREAVEAKLKPSGRRELPFANLGRSGHRDTSSRIDEILAEEWTLERLTR